MMNFLFTSMTMGRPKNGYLQKKKKTLSNCHIDHRQLQTRRRGVTTATTPDKTFLCGCIRLYHIRAVAKVALFLDLRS